MKYGASHIATVIVGLLFFAGALIYAEKQKDNRPTEQISVERFEDILNNGGNSIDPESLKEISLPPEIIEQIQKSTQK